MLQRARLLVTRAWAGACSGEAALIAISPETMADMGGMEIGGGAASGSGRVIGR